MPLRLDISLAPDELQELRATDPRSWFTSIRFRNGESPRHPAYENFDAIYHRKREMVLPWMKRVVPGKRVLDTFSANGAFAFEAMALGAANVVGVEFDPEREACAELIASYLRRHGGENVPSFEVGDVYQLEQHGSDFDVTLCLGGLYHVADPVLVLQKFRKVTAKNGYLVLQTSEVLPLPGSWARFWWIKEDQTAAGFSSLKAGSGRWRCTPKLIESLLECAGFQIIERRVPPVLKRRRFPWYCALAQAV